MIVDFRKKTAPVTPIIINGEPIAREDCFKFLGTVISSYLELEINTEKVIGCCFTGLSSELTKPFPVAVASSLFFIFCGFCYVSFAFLLFHV